MQDVPFRDQRPAQRLFTADLSTQLTVDEVYTLLEKDSSAPITADEFYKATRMVYPKITRTEARYMFTDMDTTGSGVVSDRAFTNYWPTVLVELAAMAERRAQAKAAKSKSVIKGPAEQLTYREKGLVREGAGYTLLVLLFVVTLALRRSVREIYFTNRAMHRQVTDQPFTSGAARPTWRSISSEVLREATSRPRPRSRLPPGAIPRSASSGFSPEARSRSSSM